MNFTDTTFNNNETNFLENEFKCCPGPVYQAEKLRDHVMLAVETEAIIQTNSWLLTNPDSIKNNVSNVIINAKQQVLRQNTTYNFNNKNHKKHSQKKRTILS